MKLSNIASAFHIAFRTIIIAVLRGVRQFARPYQQMVRQRFQLAQFHLLLPREALDTRCNMTVPSQTG